MIYYGIIILFLVAAIFAFFRDEKKHDEELAKQINDNRTIYKDCVHFFCNDCDNMFHISKETCDKIAFPGINSISEHVSYLVYYGKCPKCGADSNKIQRLRRVTGYLTGDYKTAFNLGKQDEVEHRVKHIGLEA